MFTAFLFKAVFEKKKVHHDKSFSPWQIVGINRESEYILFPSLEKEKETTLSASINLQFGAAGFKVQIEAALWQKQGLISITFLLSV